MTLKTPNVLQSWKIQRLVNTEGEPSAKAYCAERGLEFDASRFVEGAPLPESAGAAAEPEADDRPLTMTLSAAGAPEGVLTAASDDEVFYTGGQLAEIAQAFFALLARLESNGASSVLNWDEITNLEALCEPHLPKTAKGEIVVPEAPKPAPLPAGQRWARVVGEPPNRQQKFIRFDDLDKTEPPKILWVNISSGRMQGRNVRVKVNPDEAQGGYVLAAN